MANATVSSAGPRYAPADPTLPKPWRGLVDGKTGYLYFWNPETNVTQYERPKAPTPPPQSVSAPLEKPSTLPLSASVQVQQSSQGQPRDSNCSDDGDRNSIASNGASQLASGTRSYQGNNVPAPFTSFDATGLPLELLREHWRHLTIFNVHSLFVYSMKMICS